MIEPEITSGWWIAKRFSYLEVIHVCEELLVYRNNEVGCDPIIAEWKFILKLDLKEMAKGVKA